MILIIQINRHIHFIKIIYQKNNYQKIPENTYNIIKDVNISYDINYIQEKFFMDKNGIKPYTKFLYRKINNTKMNG